ncbi:hypothetical protein D3C71_714480 [compost metagenome]
MQHQEAAHLASGQQGVVGEVCVDLLDALADQLVHLGLLRQVGVARVGQVAAFGPVAHGVEIDVDHHTHLLAAVAQRDHFLDVREELELVLHILGRKHGAIVGAALDAAHVLHAVNDLEVAVRVEESCIAGVVPAIGGEHLGRGLGVLVVLLEQAGGLDEDLAVVGHLDLHTANRHAHRVGARLVVGLQADEHGGLGGAIQLLEVDADGAVEREQIRANGLACRVRHAHAAKAQVVAQRAVHQQVAQRVLDAVQGAHGFAVHEGGAHPLGHAHAGVEHGALDGACVFHADHHAGQQAFKNARRRKVVGGADFLQVDGHRAGRLGAVDHVAAGQPLGVAEDVLADPGRGQVGQHFFAAGELVELGTCAGAVQQGAVGVHHALGVARGARGEEHRRHIVGLGLGDLALEPLGVLGDVRLACFDQRVQRRQALFLVVAQAARVVKVDVRNLGALLADLQQLVHLLLVFHQAKAHFGVVEREHTFGPHGVLVQRNRNRAQGLRGQHGGVQAGAVGADHHHVFMALQPGQVQAGGHLLHQPHQVSPAVGLPDAIFFFAQGRGRGALGGMLEQQLRERGQHCRFLKMRGVRPVTAGSAALWLRVWYGMDARTDFDAILSCRRQFTGNYSSGKTLTHCEWPIGEGGGRGIAERFTGGRYPHGLCTPRSSAFSTRRSPSPPTPATCS